MAERSPYQDHVELLEVVESFVGHEWEKPGQIRDRMIDTVMPLPEPIRERVPGIPWSAERVRAALELLAASDRPVRRSLSRTHPDHPPLTPAHRRDLPLRVWFKWGVEV